jgi:hypothetical protein
MNLSLTIAIVAMSHCTETDIVRVCVSLNIHCIETYFMWKLGIEMGQAVA